uniref:Uncharacterized protein n=1 Tax=Arundo donax TaxID=35708 RepID=A0A0A9FRK0_ARUDO
MASLPKIKQVWFMIIGLLCIKSNWSVVRSSDRPSYQSSSLPKTFERQLTQATTCHQVLHLPHQSPRHE